MPAVMNMAASLRYGEGFDTAVWTLTGEGSRSRHFWPVKDLGFRPSPLPERRARSRSNPTGSKLLEIRSDGLPLDQSIGTHPTAIAFSSFACGIARTTIAATRPGDLHA